MDARFPLDNQNEGAQLPPLRQTPSQARLNFPLPHAPQGPPTNEEVRPDKKRTFQEIKPDDDLDSEQSNSNVSREVQRRRVVVNPNSIKYHINELSKKVARTPESAPQYVKEYVESALALPAAKGNKATVVRELFRAIDEGKFGENKEAVQAALNEYAYPAAERERDREKIHALADQKFPDNAVLKSKFVTLMEELLSTKHGIIPPWMVTKREHPSTNLSMTRTVTFSTLYSKVKPSQNPQSGSSALSSLSSALKHHPLSLLRPDQTTTTGYLNDPDFQKICEMELPGIGLQKGGVSGITDIMTDGILVATWYGKVSPVLPGAPADTCATLHGPLFALLDESSSEYKRDNGSVSEFPEDSILCYLVPTTAEKERISESLAFGREYGIISQEEEQRFKAKVKTFQEFNRENS